MGELSAEDREALRRGATDLSDICPCKLAEYRRGEAAAYERAEQIRLGLRNPLS